MFLKLLTTSTLVGLLLAGPATIGAQTVPVPVEGGSDSARVIVTSVPAGADVFLDNSRTGAVTPYEFTAPAGEFLIEVILEGYEPLAKRFEVGAGRTGTAEFRLMSFPPAPVSAADLGLLRLPKTIMMDIKAADRLEEQWSGLAETFAIVPFGQGIMARIALPEEHASSANAMIITGAGLTLGSYLIGKILGKRKRTQIQAFNEQIPAENEAIRISNMEVDETVKAANSAAVMAWQEQNAENGVVIVTIE